MINHNFFKTWTPEASYVLGYIAADGCIYKKTGRPDLVLDITSKDKSILEQIKIVLQSQHTIGLKYSGGGSRTYRLQITNHEICSDLLRLGLSQKKSLTLKPVEIPAAYFPDFTRGLFDGDGSVYIYIVNGSPQLKASFVSGSEPFLAAFMTKLCQALGIPPKTIHEEPTYHRYTTYFYIKDCEKLFRFMYGSNPTPYLKRKFDKFIEWGFKI